MFSMTTVDRIFSTFVFFCIFALICDKHDQEYYIILIKNKCPSNGTAILENQS